MSSDPRIDLLIQQLETFLIMAARPVVQRQLVAILLLTLLAALLARLLQERLHPRLVTAVQARIGQRSSSRLARLLPAARRLYFPLLGLVMVRLVSFLFDLWRMPGGLVTAVAIFFWIILVYRLLLSFLTMAVSARSVERYRTRILLPLFVFVVLLIILNQLVDLNSILQIELLNLLDTSLTVGRLFTAALWLYIFLILAWVIEEGLGKVVMPRTQAEAGVINSIALISRYLIIGIGVLLVFSTLGLNLTSLALIGTGLSVGIGFGLQQIIANFISGIVLQFEQSLRPGDVVEVNNQICTVERLNIRSTLVRTPDNVEIIIPNETFLTSQVTSYTRTEMITRITVPVGVGYDSDPKMVRTILLETAVKHGLVSPEPPPQVFFNGFGDSSLDFDLTVWVEQPLRRRAVRSDLYFMIFDALAKHNIEIPFPQRDLNLRRGWRELAQTLAAEELSDHEPKP
jgi:potassium-dependent mechanosensitive channel